MLTYFVVASVLLAGTPSAAPPTPEEIQQRMRETPMAWDNIEPYLSMIGIAHGDFNDDRSIDLQDLAILLHNYGEVGGADLALRGDLDGNARIDMDDLLKLIPNLDHDIVINYDRYTQILVENGLIDPHALAPYHEFAPYALTSDPAEHTPFFSGSWDDGDHNQTISSNYWPSNHSYSISRDIPTPPNDHNMVMTATNPNEHSQSLSTSWPANHVVDVTNGWPQSDHSIQTSADLNWPSNHFVTPSATWNPNGHLREYSAAWPPTHVYERSSVQLPYEHYTEVTEGWPLNHDLEVTHERWPESHLRQFSQGFPPPPQHQYDQSVLWPPNHYTSPSNTWPSPSLPWPPNHFFDVSEQDGVPIPQVPDHDFALTLEWLKDIWDFIPKGPTGAGGGGGGPNLEQVVHPVGPIE